jgi:hypothetical protein
MNEVFTTPDVRPASLGSTSPIAASSTGVESDAGTEAEQDHARKHVDDEVAVDRGPPEEQEPERRHAKAGREWEPDAEAHDEMAERGPVPHAACNCTK